MTNTIRQTTTGRPTMRRVAAASIVAAGLGLGGAAWGAPPPAADAAHAPPSMGGVPGSPDAYDPAGTPGQPGLGVHQMGGKVVGRSVDVDPVSPGGVGSGISTNTQPSSVGSAGSLGSSTTASPTSR